MIHVRGLFLVVSLLTVSTQTSAQTPNVKLVEQAFCGQSGMDIPRLEVLISSGVVPEADLKTLVAAALKECLVSYDPGISRDAVSFIQKHLPRDAQVPWATVGILHDSRTKQPKMYAVDSDMLSEVFLPGPPRSVAFSQVMPTTRNNPKAVASQLPVDAATPTSCWGESAAYNIVRSGDLNAIQIAIDRGLITPDRQFPYTAGIPKQIPIYDKYITIINAQLNQYRTGNHILKASATEECPWNAMKRDGLVMTLSEMLVQQYRYDASVADLLGYSLKRGFRVPPNVFHDLVLSEKRIGSISIVDQRFPITPAKEAMFDDLIAAGGDINKIVDGKTFLRRAIDAEEFGWPKGQLIAALTRRGARP